MGWLTTKLILEQMTSKDWMAEAECRQHDPEMWFPHIESAKAQQTRAALAICDSCSVATECYLYAVDLISNGAMISGIWGGRFMSNMTRTDAKLIAEKRRQRGKSFEPGHTK